MNVAAYYHLFLECASEHSSEPLLALEGLYHWCFILTYEVSCKLISKKLSFQAFIRIMECIVREHAVMTAVVTHRKHMHLNFF